MKIGILTLPLHINYGGILQAWALQTVLSRMNHDVSVFGIRPESPHSYYTLPFVWLLRLIRRIQGVSNVPIFSEIKNRRVHNRLYGDIKTFISSRVNTKIIKGLNAIPENSYDAIVVGSDQIWRREYISYLWRSKNPAEAFLSSFNCRKADRIAYAASLGVDFWDFSDCDTINIKEALSRFKAVSLREISAGNVLEQATGISASFVIDPTMLLKSEDYVECLGLHVDETATHHLVSYILDSNSESERLISKIVTSRGLSHKELNLNKTGNRLLSVEEWVESIANAEMVITDSYHGCVFSIIFNKPLVFIYNEARGNARFASLIATFGIQNNCLESIDEYDSSKTYCLPENIHSKLDILRIQSMSWLSKSLQG